MAAVIRIDDEIMRTIFKTKHRIELATNRTCSINEALRFLLALKEELPQ